MDSFDLTNIAQLRASAALTCDDELNVWEDARNV